jgi:hypothetical protein
MSTSFLITELSVKYPSNGNNPWSPLVYNVVGNTQINGYSPSLPMNLQEPIKIHNIQNPPAGSSFVNIATQRGQYQLYWNTGDAQQPFQVLLQSMTSPKPYPTNQYVLWSGNNPNQNFNLSIDLTNEGEHGGISLIPQN